MGRGDLIQIAAPDTPSKRLKRRTNMSVPATLSAKSVTEVETTLFTSDTYIETISIKSIATQPWLTEVVIKTQFLTAKNPLEKRVKARCCIGTEQLVELRDALDHYLEVHFKRGAAMSSTNISRQSELPEVVPLLRDAPKRSHHSWED